MSNKLVKKKMVQSKTKDQLKDHPTLEKMYKWAEKGLSPEAKKRNMVNNIISSVFIELLILYLSYKVDKYIFACAGIFFCIINSLFASYKVYKKENNRYQIAMIVTQVIFIILYILSLFGIK